MERMLGTRRSALLLSVAQLLQLVNSARSMVPLGSALLATALQLPNLLKKEIAGCTAVTARRKYAKSKAAPPWPKHVMSATSMVRKARANLMAALPTHTVVDLHIAGNTAVENRSRAPWRAAPPPLLARVSVPSTAVVKRNAGSQAAPARWSAGSRLARRTVGLVTVHSKNARRLQIGQVETVPSITADSLSIYINYFTILFFKKKPFV